MSLSSKLFARTVFFGSFLATFRWLVTGLLLCGGSTFWYYAVYNDLIQQRRLLLFHIAENDEFLGDSFFVVPSLPNASLHEISSDCIEKLVAAGFVVEEYQETSRLDAKKAPAATIKAEGSYASLLSFFVAMNKVSYEYALEHCALCLTNKNTLLLNLVITAS